MFQKGDIIKRDGEEVEFIKYGNCIWKAIRGMHEFCRTQCPGQHVVNPPKNGSGYVGSEVVYKLVKSAKESLGKGFTLTHKKRRKAISLNTNS